MTIICYDLETKERAEREPTVEEAVVIAANAAAWDAENTPDKLANRHLDRSDGVIFELCFNQENRLRSLEGAAQITRTQFRNALIALWKQLNP